MNIEILTDISEILGSIVATSAILVPVGLRTRERYKKRTSEFKQLNPHLQVLVDYDAVKSKLFSIMDDDIKNSRNIDLINIGLDLEKMLPDLVRYITERKGNRQGKISRVRLHYKGLVIDPQSPAINALIGSDSNIKPINAENAFSLLKIFNETFLVDREDISAELSTYNVPLVIHGIMLNREHLMLGFTELNADHSVIPTIYNMQGSNKPYIYLKNIKPGDQTVATEHYFTFFREWFDYYFERGKRRADV